MRVPKCDNIRITKRIRICLVGEIPRGIFYAQIREGGADHAVQESERTGTVLVRIQILGPTSVSQKEVILCPESLRSLALILAVRT